jgi:hypothetical protein
MIGDGEHDCSPTVMRGGSSAHCYGHNDYALAYDGVWRMVAFLMLRGVTV